MKRLLTAFLLAFTLAFACYGQTVNPGAPVAQPKDILRDDNFLNYVGGNIKLLSANYTAYDAGSKIISKGEFLRKLTTRNYFYIQLNSTDHKLYLKLYKLSGKAKKSYGGIVYAYTRLIYDEFKHVGKKFPAFDFVDINGNRYNSQNTKGKIVVLKCWFIGCTTCVEEMPALNELVKQYKHRKDIIFVSLAPDSKAKLQAFFKNRTFDYQKVPGQDAFITKTLNVSAYPTHFIINKQGTIVNVVDSPEEIAYTLKNDI